MKSPRRILALSFFPAFVPPTNGGIERLYNFYAALSDYHDVTLLSSSFVNGDREVVRHRPSFTEIRVPKDDHFAAAYAELDKVRGDGDLSGPALAKSLGTIGALHDEYLAHYPQADVIIHDSPFLVECDLFRGFDSKLRVYNSYNCETELYSSFHAGHEAVESIPALVRAAEAELCRHCDLITVCSDEDAEAFRRQFSPGAPIIKVTNGHVPRPVSPGHSRDTQTLVFLGSAHKPNVDAARLIVDAIAPHMRDVEFHLIGSCHAKGSRNNVFAHGIVSQDEKKALLRRATAALNPMVSGGGSSLKIADIASSGCPIISSRLGARGFDLEPGIHYIPLDTNDPISAIRAALNEPDRLVHVADAAAQHFERHYSWREIVSSFVAHLDQMLQARVKAPTARLVVNDYDSLASTGGGATRTRGLCQGLAQSAPVIFLAFATDGVARRRVSDDRRTLSLLVNKTPAHLDEHSHYASVHWVSTADVVNYQHAPLNTRLMALFRCAASASAVIICEHPYMAGLPGAFGLDFVYSSQNFEARLKADGLWSHPDKEHLLALVDEAETFACGASSFIVAVSQTDAAELGAAYASTAPILIIPNGADGAAADVARAGGDADADEQPVAIFMGSVHGPNYEAARWIVTELAPSLPQYKFVIIGSVAQSIADSGANVALVGEVSAVDKTRHLYAAHVALNPMMTGSGSNVKMADYLQHGLPVLTTAFGARGYEWVPSNDAKVADLDVFKEELRALIEGEGASVEAREAREATYASLLAMEAGGRLLAQLIEAHAGVRKRALYVTYRYLEPPRGGGEEYVDRLAQALAASGWEVDVVAPTADRIVDLDRFSTAFYESDLKPIPTGHERVRTTKFPLGAALPGAAELRRLWNYQPDFEEIVARTLRVPAEPCLAWGWADDEGHGRWCLRSAGLFVPAGGTMSLKARALKKLWLQIFSGDGRLLHDVEVTDELDLTLDVPPGFIAFAASMDDLGAVADPRPLALFATHVEIDGRSLLEDRFGDAWSSINSASERMAALVAARRAVRDRRGLALSPLRSPSDALDDHVRAHIGEYDLLLTHNAIFKGATAAISAANAAGVPSILVPHLHYDDDFYHFPDVLAACATASRTLVCPRAVKRQLADEGLTNVAYLSPGVDTSTRYGDEVDVANFTTAAGGLKKDFFLVLGRKTGAKGYHDIIDALDCFAPDDAPMIVMIGSDDDGFEIEHPGVKYLGRQPDSVVRGALHQCLGLINMSRSESFGMVLLQAGLAAKPVIANRNCAAFADLVDDGANGFLVSRDELAARMETLHKDPVLRRNLGDEGRVRALLYSWEKIEASFVRICETVLASR